MDEAAPEAASGAWGCIKWDSGAPEAACRAWGAIKLEEEAPEAASGARGGLSRRCKRLTPVVTIACLGGGHMSVSRVSGVPRDVKERKRAKENVSHRRSASAQPVVLLMEDTDPLFEAPDSGLQR